MTREIYIYLSVNSNVLVFFSLFFIFYTTSHDFKIFVMIQFEGEQSMQKKILRDRFEKNVSWQFQPSLAIAKGKSYF